MYQGRTTIKPSHPVPIISTFPSLQGPQSSICEEWALQWAGRPWCGSGHLSGGFPTLTKATGAHCIPAWALGSAIQHTPSDIHMDGIQLNYSLCASSCGRDYSVSTKPHLFFSLGTQPDRPHFSTSLAVRLGHETEFWPMKCAKK